ncbi:RHS repeat protein, partial [Sphingomonas sp. Root241]|uniref:RHS repeat protein n=1 Tax=Sphingomonas sp. Root241 TaxID=1736501 RepID=UPI00138EF23E
NAKDATTSFTYDKLGRVKTTTDAEGYVETNWYDAFGGITQTQSKLGLITDFKYNKRGLVESEYVNAPVYGAAGNQVAAGYYRNKFEYYANGNVKRQIEADGLAERRDTVFAYDRAGRLILKEGTPVAVGQAGSLVTPAEHYAYDKRGNLIETWDAAGGHSWYWYDDLDRKVAEIVAVTTTQGTYSAYGYDDVGNLKSSKVYAGWASLPASAGGTPPAPPAGEYRETTFDYDNINRLTSESVAGQAIGYWQNGSYVYTTGTLTTSYQYDATGNVVKMTDPTLVSVYSYYDKLGRETAEVDALGYATSWVRDAEGNVLTERRYSGVASNVSTSGYTAPGQTNSDRLTSFEYDRMGRRRKEMRHDVVAWSLNTANGQLDLRTGPATISVIEYLYNGLGEVTQKIEATGDTTTYIYDSAGRLTTEHRNGFVDYAGTAVTPSVRYYYNGLDSLVRTEQGGASASSADRVTTNSYGAGGRLTGTTDAAGNVRSYIYDAAGRKTGEYYSRDLGNGTSVTEGLGFEYDRAGNVTRQSVNTISGGVWSAVSATTSSFNAYGEVTTRGTNGGAQEQFAYDGAGRLIRTNSGDGVWRHFYYDAAGRQTMVLESEGMDLSGLSQAQAYDNASTDGVNTTVTVYDRRGQATGTIQRLRETAVGGARPDIAIDRGYNAFGEMLWEEDAYDRRTDYTVNSMGRVTQIQRPAVSVTAESGAQSSIRPTEKLFYDISGRLIGTQDANSVQAETLTGLSGYKTTRQLLAGTGYGGGEAMVVKEWHPDGGTPVNRYDVFGDLRTATDEINRTTSMAWNKLGQLTQVTRPGGLDEYYAYDLLGNRIGHWNEVTGYAARERTEYDAMGRVTLQRVFGGDTTTTSYSWSSGLATSGMGNFGGWVETTTYQNGLSATEYTDVFGRVTWKSDLGGHTTDTTYDLAGRMTGRTTSGAHGTETASYVWLNNGQVGTVTTIGGYTTTQSSSYDLTGNKLTETTTRDGVVIQNATATYDALNRLLTWSEAGNTTLPAASMTYGYDAASNVRRMQSSFRWLDQNGVASTSVATQDYWYRYDSMNRMTTSQGSLSGGVIGGGTQVTYDAAGQRMSVSTMSSGLVWSGWKAVLKGSGGQVARYADYPESEDDGYIYIWSPSGPVHFSGKAIETYSYTADGLLETVSVAGEGGTAESGWPAGNGVMGASELRASYGYDPQGRLASQIDYENATTVAYSRTGIVYDTAGRVTSETIAARQTVTGSTSATTT